MFLSRCARAKATHSCGGTYLVRPVRIGSGSKRCSGVCRLVLAQQRGRSARRTGARQRGGCRRPQPRSHAGPWIEFFLHCALPVLGYRGTVRDGSAFVICIIDISRFDNEPITAQSINCLCRSTRRVRLTSLRRDHHEIVSQITPILWPGSPICRICERYGRSTPARTGLHKIQQVSRFCTRRNASIAFHREARSKCSVRQSHWERSTRTNARSQIGMTKPQAANIFHRLDLSANGFHAPRGDRPAARRRAIRHGRQQDTASPRHHSRCAKPVCPKPRGNNRSIGDRN